MKLIVISNPTNVPDEHNLLCSLFDLGLTHFHLRKPEFSWNEMNDYIKQIPNEYLNRIVIHSHHELADKYSLKGKHKPAFVETVKNAKNYISTSFHTLEELKNCTYNYEYTFLSPIYDSISKREYKSNFDKIELKNFIGSYNKKFEIIALGGIEEKNIIETLDLGFDGVALLGAIWQSKNTLNTFDVLTKYLDI